MTQATVGVIGSGPAVDALTAALDERSTQVEATDAADADGFDLVAVVAPADSERFEAVTASRAGPWLAVELGGLGGLRLGDVTAGVSVLSPVGPCYDCLGARVASTAAGSDESRSAVDRSDARLAGAIAGHLAIEVLEGSVSPGRVVEFPYVQRELLALPGCDCDATRWPSLDRSAGSVEFESVVGRAERAVDSRLGPVTSIGEVESFPAAYYLAELCDTRGFSDVRASRQAAGAAADWNPAFVKAVGEALERYSAGVYREAAFETATVDALDDAVSPDRFVRPTDDAEPPADEPIAWVTGEHLESVNDVHLPAERVVFPPPTEATGPSITTGLGLGSSGLGAIVSGLTEVVERDATMLAWYSTFEPLRLTVDDANFTQLVRRARAEDLSVTPLLVTQDIDVPVVTVAVHRDGDWPRFAVGAGAALDPVAAARGALEEALQNWMELRAMGAAKAEEEEPRVARYADRPPAADALVDVEEAVPASAVGPAEVPSGPAALESLLDRVASADLDAYAAALTPRDVRTIGFEAVRVLVPEAQPLFTGDRFFGERARTVPRTLGFRPRLDRPPHPYP